MTEVGDWLGIMARDAGEESGEILVPREIVRQMVEQARGEAPRECCGLLAGKWPNVTSIYPLTNESERPEDEYFVGEGLFPPIRRMRQLHEDLLGIYHSHPSSPAVPSRKDRERNYYPDAVHFIVSLMGESPVIEAYRLSAKDWRSVVWRETGDSNSRAAKRR